MMNLMLFSIAIEMLKERCRKREESETTVTVESQSLQVESLGTTLAQTRGN